MTQRNENLKVDFKKFDTVVVSDSMVSWGKEWETTFGLVGFIPLKNSVRMKRLKKQEAER